MSGLFASMSPKTASMLTAFGLIFSAVVTIWTLMFINKNKNTFEAGSKKKLYDATMVMNVIYLVLLTVSAFQLFQMGHL